MISTPRRFAASCGIVVLVVAAAIAMLFSPGTGVRPVSAEPDPIILQLKFPDLKVSYTSFVTTSTSVYLLYTVTNSGNADAGPFRIAVRNQNNAVLEWQTVNGLAKGASATYLHKLPPFSCGGAHQRTVQADATHVIFEWNENNNTATNTWIYPPC
jgi:subtilase family serine protease